MKVPVSFRTLHATADKTILVDSGATDNFIHPKLLRRLGLGSKPLETLQKIWNIDGTTNKAGALTHSVDLEVRTGNKQEVMKFLVTDLGGEDLILGYPWLSTFEPKFRWRDAVIDTSFLPIIIRSIDWRKTRIKPVIARIVLGRRLRTQRQKRKIFQELERESSLKGISIELSREAGKNTQEVTVPKEYQRHAKIFDPVESKKLPPSRPWDHAITLKPDAPDTIDCKLYPLPPKDDKALCKWLKEEEDKGYIRPSISPIASSFFFLRKADRSQRPVQDHRGVNKLTVCNRYPLPLIPELIAEVQDVFVFSKFDVEGGFNKVRIKDGDQHKAVFKTKYGLYEPMVMYFSLCNSPATFQNMMNHIFQPLKDKWAKRGVKIIVYMDDILIATSTSRQDRRDATHDVLDLLQEHNLFLKKKKCYWEVNSINYLGLILEKGVTRMDPTKVEGIKNWPRPAKVKDVCSFLGFCNFYQPFIPSFSKIAKPPNELTHKDVPFVWEDKHESAFNTLRDFVTSEPVLRQPQLDKPFKVEVDASGFTLGGVLLQIQEDGKKHPIGYYSTTLNEAQQNYDIYELELLTIAECLKHWRPYLAGSPHEIIVHTDHANLMYWRQPQKISRPIARQVLECYETMRGLLLYGYDSR